MVLAINLNLKFNLENITGTLIILKQKSAYERN